MSEEKPIDPKLHELLTELEKYWNHLLESRTKLDETLYKINDDDDNHPLKVTQTVLGKILIDLFEVIKDTGFILEVFDKSLEREQKGISLEDLLSNSNIQLLDDWKDPDKYKGDDTNDK